MPDLIEFHIVSYVPTMYLNHVIQAKNLADAASRFIAKHPTHRVVQISEWSYHNERGIESFKKFDTIKDLANRIICKAES